MHDPERKGFGLRFIAQSAFALGLVVAFFHFARSAAGLPFIEEKAPQYVIYGLSAAVVWSLMWRARAKYTSESFARSKTKRWLLIGFGMLIFPSFIGVTLSTQARWFGYHSAMSTTELRGTVSSLRQLRKFRTDYLQLTLKSITPDEQNTLVEWQVSTSKLEPPQPSWIGKTACLDVSQTIFGRHVRSVKLC